jgi:hypothetical protein
LGVHYQDRDFLGGTRQLANEWATPHPEPWSAVTAAELTKLDRAKVPMHGQTCCVSLSTTTPRKSLYIDRLRYKRAFHALWVGSTHLTFAFTPAVAFKLCIFLHPAQPKPGHAQCNAFWVNSQTI